MAAVGQLWLARTSMSVQMSDVCSTNIHRVWQPVPTSCPPVTCFGEVYVPRVINKPELYTSHLRPPRCGKQSRHCCTTIGLAPGRWRAANATPPGPRVCPTQCHCNDLMYTCTCRHGCKERCQKRQRLPVGKSQATTRKKKAFGADAQVVMCVCVSATSVCVQVRRWVCANRTG